jgi:hypothetical protein
MTSIIFFVIGFVVTNFTQIFWGFFSFKLFHLYNMSKDFILQIFRKIKFYAHKTKIIFLVTRR